MTLDDKIFIETCRDISNMCNKGYNFYVLLHDYLDEFYRSSNEKRIIMMAEPPLAMPRLEYLPYLAAAVHKLANDYSLPPPDWVFEKKCFLPRDQPHFGCMAKGDLKLWFMFSSPLEFKFRNLFVDENVLMRV